MKLIYITLFGLFFVLSCTPDKGANAETDKDNKVEIKTIENESSEASFLPEIAYQWILTNRTNASKDKNVDYNTTAPSIITHFESNGFFSVYDFIELGNDESKFKTLEARSSGQWEVHNENELIMRHSLNDSSKTEYYIIEKLDDKQLVIKNTEKDIIDTYQRKK